MSGRRVVVLALALLATTLAAGASPATAQTSPPCEVGRALVDVSYRFANDQDLTDEGEVWALGTGVATFRLYATGPGTFCAVTLLSGTFTTFAGPSPNGTGTVPAGHTGRFAGKNQLRFVGTFAPSLPTRGFVGSFDAGCNQVDCETPIQFGRFYLDVAGPPLAEDFRFAYASSCGTFVQTSQGSFGDIAC